LSTQVPPTSCARGKTPSRPARRRRGIGDRRLEAGLTKDICHRLIESYSVLFTDGPFVYSVDLSGPPGSVTEEQAEEIAGALHDRVQGAPPAS
jgi:hypothetical protein